MLLLQVSTGGVGDQEEESLQGEDPGLYGHQGPAADQLQRLWRVSSTVRGELLRGQSLYTYLYLHIFKWKPFS